MSAKTFNVPIEIDYPYNPGEWRLSRHVTGPRGGKSWQKIYSCPATGGYLPDARLEPGEYKVTYWSNGWPYSYRFAVTEDGQRIDYPDY